MLEHAKALVEPTAREVVERLLDRTGVQINGPNPWDIEVHDDDLYARVLAHGSLGLGEAYMEGWWDAEALDVCLFRLMRAKLDLHVLGEAPDDTVLVPYLKTCLGRDFLDPRTTLIRRSEPSRARPRGFAFRPG